jgi:GAF domain-containing protein
MSASVDAHALAGSLERLRDRNAGAGLETSLQQVADACVELFDVDGSGLMLIDERGALRYVTSTDHRARLLEEVELDTGQGPCVDSFLTAEPVWCTDVRTDPRWPLLADRLAGNGIAAVLGVPIHLLGVPVGTLDVYRGAPHRWTDSALDALVRFGEVVEAVITTAVHAERAGDLVARMSYALDHRNAVERATGYVMARERVGRPAAFERLRRSARAQNRGIGDVATALLDTGRMPGDPL